MTILYGNSKNIVNDNSKNISNKLQKQFIELYKLISILILLFLNEFLWCEKMQSILKFPYHMINEIVGSIIFYKIGHLYLTLEKINK